jgi:aspartate/methionine/tyrosine aminotransferase
MKKYDFAWGNPYFLLELLDESYYQKLAAHDIRNMVYAPNNGFTELVEQTKQVVKQSTGLEYKHIIITAGATQAISSLFKYQKTYQESETVITTPYGYPYYDDMICHQGLGRYRTKELFRVSLLSATNCFWLVDSPSNPEGIQTHENTVAMAVKDKVFWDAVYHSPIYTKDLKTLPSHIAMVGSYSKLLGLTGARIGWIATNDVGVFYHKVKDIVLKDTATVSVPSQKLIIDILNSIDLEAFMQNGRRRLDYNREQFQKIEYLFDGQAVQEAGMFYCAHVDRKALKLLDKCGINYIQLDYDYIRLSMGQTQNITKKGIRAILKEDRK